jgi:hypothetical protein
MGCGYRKSCRNLKKLNILALKLQYINALMMIVVNNGDCFVSNKDCHSVNTRQINNLRLPQVNLTVFKMGVYYSGVKILNNFPLKDKEISILRSLNH